MSKFPAPERLTPPLELEISRLFRLKLLGQVIVCAELPFKTNLFDPNEMLEFKEISPCTYRSPFNELDEAKLTVGNSRSEPPGIEVRLKLHVAELFEVVIFAGDVWLKVEPKSNVAAAETKSIVAFVPANSVRTVFVIDPDKFIVVDPLAETV